MINQPCMVSALASQQPRAGTHTCVLGTTVADVAGAHMCNPNRAPSYTNHVRVDLKSRHGTRMCTAAAVAVTPIVSAAAPKIVSERVKPHAPSQCFSSALL
jgi:hypothetical protein